MFKLKQSSPRACWLVGHRGAMGHAPENTFASFNLAHHLGAEFVECDVHLSKDKRVVVIHDERVDRTTDGHGFVKDLTLQQIKKLDAGSWHSKKFKGERVPTLEELLLWAKKQISHRRFQMGVAIEIKNHPVRYPEIAERVIETLVQTGMESRVVLISFDHGAVKEAKAVNEKVATGILYDKALADPCKRALQMKADALFPRGNLVTKRLVQKAHKEGLAVATWTVNEPREMKRIIACGADAIATNFPERLNRILN